MIETPIPHSVLQASGVVGAWTHDRGVGRLTLSAGFAELVGLDPGGGVPLQALLERAHPDDRLRIESYFHAVAATGGPVEAEFRTRESPAGLRTLLMRGRIEREPGGARQGCGIVIDRTDGRATGPMPEEQLVNRMAEHVITMRGLAQSLRRPVLVERVDCLMVEIGFELARFLSRPGDELRH